MAKLAFFVRGAEVSIGPEIEYVVDFSHRHAYSTYLFTLSDVNQDHWPSLPLGDFEGVGGAASFRDMINDKSSFEKQEQQFVLFRIERETRCESSLSLRFTVLLI